MRLARLIGCTLVLLFAVRLTVAQDLLVSARFGNNVLRFDSRTGAFKSVFASGSGMKNPNGLAIGPDGNLYVGLGDEGTVLRFDGQTGAFIDRFVFDDPATAADETGGLSLCRAIRFGPDGNLYVAAGADDAILRYDGRTGRFAGIAASGGGLRGPVGLAIGADGTLYVGGALDNALHIYRDGKQLRQCSAPSLAGTIVGVAFGRDRLLYAATAARNTVIRFRPDNCQSLGVFAHGVNTPVYLAFDEEGNLLAGGFGDNSVARFDGKSGASLGPFVASGAGGLNGTHDFAFIPAPAELVTTPILVVPAVAHAQGALGAFFRTSMWLTNPGDVPMTVRIRFVPGAGFIRGDAVDTGVITIAPRGMLSYADVMSEAFHATVDTAGVAIIELAAGSPAPLVTARSFNDTSNGTLGQYIEALPAGGAIASDAWIDGLAADAATRTNVGIVNFGTSDADIALSVWDANGVRAGSDVHLIAPARSSIQAGGIPAAAGVSGLTQFSVRAGTPGTYALYASKLDNVTSDPIFITPLVPRRQQWIDGVGSLRGAAGTFFKSSLSLANHGSATAVIHIAYTARGDVSPSRSVDVALTAGATRYYADVIADLLGNLNGGANTAGALTLDSDQPVAAWVRTYNDRASAGTLGQFIPSYGQENLIGSRGAIIQGLSENATFRTNVAVFNTASMPADVTITAFASDGTALARRIYPVRGGEEVSINQILAVFGVAPVANAYLRVESSVPGAIYAAASSVDNTSTDQTFVRPLSVP